MIWQVIRLMIVTLPLCVIAERLPIRSYTTADGLAADEVDCIVPDSRGFIWFCTPEGLTRFDGHRMVNFSAREGLADRRIESFLPTRSGSYLVGTAHGLSQFRSSGAGFSGYRGASGPFEKSIATLWEASSGEIWCGAGNGLFEASVGGVLAAPKWSAPGKNTVSDIKEDGHGRLWVATTDGIYILGTAGPLRHIAAGDGLPGLWVNDLLRDHVGRMWAAMRGGLVLMRDGDTAEESGVQRIYTKKDGLPVVDLHVLAEGADGAIWVGHTRGISILPASGDPVFRNLTRVQGLTDTTIVALAADRSGDMWAGTVGAGAMRIASSGLVTFGEKDGLASDHVYSAFADRDGSLVTVSDGPVWRAINILDPANTKFSSVIPKVFGERGSWGWNQILLQARTGEWWAPTRVGLCRFPPIRVAELATRQPRCYAPDVFAYAVFEDSRGGIWASAQSAQGDRLMRWDPARDAISWFEDGPSSGELVEAFAEDHSGNIWMGCSRGELLRYDGRRFARLRASDRTPAGAIDALLVDRRGRLWIGSLGGGVGMLEQPANPPFHVRIYDTAAGLASDTIFALVEDSMGRIYVGGGKGVDRLDPATGHVKSFSSADGLAHGQTRSAFRDRAGNLWFATTQGLSRLTPAPGRPLGAPTVLITDVKVFGKTYPVSQAGEGHLAGLGMDYARNQLQAAFAGFSDEPEENLRYTYKLEGAASDWKEPDREHEANYPGLGPGQYRFLVKAVNSEGRWSAAPAEIDFEVFPPFWRRWWFDALSAAAMACMIFAAYRYRLREITARVRLRYEERLDERTRIARELHDTLLQSLAGVALQLDGVAKQIAPASEAAAERIRAVRRQVETSFREARRKVQDLRSPLLEGRALENVMQETLEQIAAGHPVRLRITVTGEPRPLREDLEETVLRIGQEAVANAVRHAQATEIQVRLSYDEGALSLRVQDDGQGFDLDDPRHGVGHWGLRTMQERAHRIGAKWKITSAAGHGTGIDTIVPLARGQ